MVNPYEKRLEKSVKELANMSHIPEEYKTRYVSMLSKASSIEEIDFIMKYAKEHGEKSHKLIAYEIMKLGYCTIQTNNKNLIKKIRN